MRVGNGVEKTTLNEAAKAVLESIGRTSEYCFPLPNWRQAYRLQEDGAPNPGQGRAAKGF